MVVGTMFVFSFINDKYIRSIRLNEESLKTLLIPRVFLFNYKTQSSGNYQIFLVSFQGMDVFFINKKIYPVILIQWIKFLINAINAGYGLLLSVRTSLKLQRTPRGRVCVWAVYLQVIIISKMLKLRRCIIKMKQKI